MSGSEEIEEPTGIMARCTPYCKWTESMRLRLIDTVMRVDEELRKGGFTSRSKGVSRLKWRVITDRMPEDFFDQRVHRKAKWMSILKSQFQNARHCFLSGKSPSWFTDQLITKMRECEELMFSEPNVEPGCSALAGLCDQVLHDDISREAQALVTAVGLDEPHIQEVAERQDGRGETLQDHPYALIENDVSLPTSTNWATVHASNTSLPTSSRRGKRAISESSITTSSSSEEATGDAPPSRTLRIGQRYRDGSRPVGPAQRQKQIDDSAASRCEAETSANRERQCQGDNLSQRAPSLEDVETVSNTIFLENMKSSLFVRKLLDGLPREKTVEDKLGKFLLAQEHGGDNTTCLLDRFVRDQQHTTNRVQLMIQARHEELKVRMTEVIKQTSDELLHVLLNFASGESCID